MKVLFKYYKGLPEGYLDNPTIKLSQTSKLNDPFEKTVDKSLMDLVLACKPRNGVEAKFINSMKDAFPFINELNFRGLIENVGIVSLTETPRNLLMWSHYANQHKGICIGYNSNLLEDRNDLDLHLPSSYKTLKVNYDNCRYDQYTDIFSTKNINELRREIVLKSLLTKGDDWIYEKEHRAIIPMKFHDHIICTGEHDAYSYKEKYDFIEVIDKNSFKLNDDGKLNTYVMMNEEDLAFVVKIKRESITSIYFGCNSDIVSCNEIYDHIMTKKELSHIKVYQAIPSKTKFELNFVPFSEYGPPVDDD